MDKTDIERKVNELQQWLKTQPQLPQNIGKDQVHLDTLRQK